MFIQKGDWVRYRGSEGWTVEKKVLEVRPDGKLVVGEHDNDPNPSTIEKSDVSSKIK
jgi:hypothetical protein